ncbi:adenosylhomocysteinase, partial [Pseudonocardia xishanensis]
MTTIDGSAGRFQEIGGVDFAVADLGLHEFGRKEIRLAENEMPGL